MKNALLELSNYHSLVA